MRNVPRGLTLFVIGAALTGCLTNTNTNRSTSNKPSSSGKPAPDIRGIDADGKPFQLSDYSGKVVLLDFWASW